MLYSNLLDLINGLTYGTKLQIGVIFFGSLRSEQLIIPLQNSIHTAPFCRRIKSNPQHSRRCYLCRNLTIRKALQTATPFGGICLNGLYEYTHPIVVSGTVIGLIFIGNILDMENGYDLLLRRFEECGLSEEADVLFDSIDRDFPKENCRILGNLIESYIRLILDKSPAEAPLTDKSTLLHDLIAFVDDNINTGVDYKILSEIFHYNEKYLGRIFKRELGMSIRVYICKRRIEQAAYLLKESNESIISIASRTGFNNISYFARRFHEFMGMTPMEYRNHSREGIDGDTEKKNRKRGSTMQRETP